LYTIALHDWLQQRLSLFQDHAQRRPAGAVLADLIRNGILSGALTQGLRLPSSRALAADLEIARNTVVAVYEQLQSEGFLVAGQGSGTYVSHIAGGAMYATRWSSDGAGAAPAPGPHLALSKRGAAYFHHPIHRHWHPRPFCGASMDPGLFPQALWTRLQQQRLRFPDAAGIGEGEPAGALELKSAIADHVAASAADLLSESARYGRVSNPSEYLGDADLLTTRLLAAVREALA